MIYRHKHWHVDPQEAELIDNDPDVMWVTCPACAKIAEHYPEGVVTLQGDYLWKHEREIRNLLENETEHVLKRILFQGSFRSTCMMGRWS